jgi:hypothetical protein
MKKVLKSILLAVIIVPMVFVATACSNGNGNEFGKGMGDIKFGENITPTSFIELAASQLPIIDKEGNEIEVFFTGTGRLHWIARITHWNQLVFFVGVPCDITQDWVSPPILEKYTYDFFNDNDLLIFGFTALANTVGIKISDTMTVTGSMPAFVTYHLIEIRSGKPTDFIVGIAIGVSFAIGVTKHYVNVSSTVEEVFTWRK